MKRLCLRIDENSMVAAYKQQEEKRSSQREESRGLPTRLPATCLLSLL